MPKMTIEQPHKLPADEARKLLDTLSKDLSDKYGLSSRWLTDTEAKVERTGATGSIRIEVQRVIVDLDLSFALTPLKGKIESRIREELKKLFDAQPA
jgi:putative polyhydroxyalkanoate system protein